MTRASDQQKKQRLKEFRERQEHQKLLKAMSKKAKPDPSGKDEIDKAAKTVD